jgi:hypothetical protein
MSNNSESPHITSLKEILKLSLPHCEDGNPCENEFIEINKIAHQTFKKIQRLGIQEPKQ